MMCETWHMTHDTWHMSISNINIILINLTLISHVDLTLMCSNIILISQQPNPHITCWPNPDVNKITLISHAMSCMYHMSTDNITLNMQTYTISMYTCIFKVMSIYTQIQIYVSIYTYIVYYIRYIHLYLCIYRYNPECANVYYIVYTTTDIHV